jgi:prevent-host-death family protein
MNIFDQIAHEPLGKLLGGVNREVFRQRPRTVGLRDLQRDMSATLSKARAENEYIVLTNRGAPSFLLIPIDPYAWTSLLASAAPETDFEVEKARKWEKEGATLPDTAAILGSVDDHPLQD